MATFVSNPVSCTDEYELMKQLSKDVMRSYNDTFTKSALWMFSTALDVMKTYLKKQKEAGQDLSDSILYKNCMALERSMREDNGEVFTD